MKLKINHYLSFNDEQLEIVKKLFNTDFILLAILLIITLLIESLSALIICLILFIRTSLKLAQIKKVQNDRRSESTK